MSNDFAFYEEKVTDKSYGQNTAESMTYKKEVKQYESESKDRSREAKD